MIRVEEADEPASFDKKVRTPGLRAIAEMVGEKPARPAGKRFRKKADRREDLSPTDFPNYWTACLPELKSRYQHICAYSCFRIHPITGAASVDHMAPKSRDWNRVYEWDNYRLACARLNARKNNFSDVLDPFEIENGWFQLELLGFTVVPKPELSARRRTKVRHTIERLGLDNFAAEREEDAENYWRKDVSWKILKQESPFVAMELERQGRLNPADIPN